MQVFDKTNFITFRNILFKINFLKKQNNEKAPSPCGRDGAFSFLERKKI